MNNNFLMWDPSWGWENQIYYLGAMKDEGSFYMANSALYVKGKQCFAPSRGRLAAGSFDEKYYYGSISHDIYKDGRRYINQEIFVLDRNWQEITAFKPSDFLTTNNKFISNTISSKEKYVAFRDPVKLPNGNLAVCTGGSRWNTFGNVCEVSFKNQQLELVQETILDDSMLSFKEIERVCFWQEWMFFSVNGGSSIWDKKSRIIHVAKLNGSQKYSYHSTISNSWMCYGPDITSDLRMLYWIKRIFKINSPKYQNLFYQKGNWHLKERSPRHYFFTAWASYPLFKQKLIDIPAQIIQKNPDLPDTYR